ILVFVSGLLFGITKSSTFTAADFVHGLQYLPVLFIQSLGYMLLGLLIAFIFRNTAFSIIAYLLYFFPVEPIVRAFMSDSAAAFMPVKTIANLTPMPDFVGISLSDVIQISNGTGSLEMIGTASQSTPLLTTSLVTIGYCLIFGIIVKVIAVNKNF
ncbi:MAG TPA: hypothetical protein PLV65_11830, partial [Tenuifilaceae bacterium]|nr:hypothetical protein [Tenuifilaceae bacterium]